MNIIFIIIVTIILALEWLLRKLEKKTIENTAVSSDENSDYTYSSLSKLVINVSFGVICLLLLSIHLLHSNPLAIVTLAILYIGFRIFLFVILKRLAKTTASSRLDEILNKKGFIDASFVFYFSAPDLHEPTHVNMWIEPLNSLNMKWFVIVRERVHLKYFREPNRPKAIFIEKNSDLTSLLPPDTNTVFYANNGQKNRTMIAAEPDATHVQLLHGDSDKPPSFSPLSKNFNYLFVAGKMAIDRYKNNGVFIDNKKFKIVGRPQVSEIITGKTNNTIRTIGYMPTWRGFFEDTEFSSLDRSAQIIKNVSETLKESSLLFKPHPMSFKDPEWPVFHREITSSLVGGSREVTKDETPFDIFNASDILICDISSVMIDFLYSGKPLIVVIPKWLAESDYWRFPSLEAAYLVKADLSNLAETLFLAATTDPFKIKREKIREEAFGDFGRPVGEAFKMACLNIMTTNS